MKRSEKEEVKKMPKEIESTEADLIIDTRDPVEKVADALAGDRIDPGTGAIIRDQDEVVRIVEEDADKDAAERIRGVDWIDPETDLIEPTVTPPTPTSSDVGTVHFPPNPAVGPPRINKDDESDGQT